jgi:hypothetical protein
LNSKAKHSIFGFLSCSFVSLVLSSSFVFLLIMVTSTELIAASLGHLFKSPDAMLGSSWVESVLSGWTNVSLPSLVVSHGTLHTSKARDMYIHFYTAT